jgi:ribosomal protein S11
MMLLLMKAGADTEAKDGSGETPSEKAVSGGHVMPVLGGPTPWALWDAGSHREFPTCFRQKVSTLIVCAVLCDDEGGVHFVARLLGELIEALSAVMSETVSFGSPRALRLTAAPPPKPKAERPSKSSEDPRASGRRVRQGARLVLDAGQSVEADSEYPNPLAVTSTDDEGSSALASSMGRSGAGRARARKGDLGAKTASKARQSDAGQSVEADSEYPNPFAMTDDEGSSALASSMGRSGAGKSRAGKMDLGAKMAAKARHTSRRPAEEERKPRGPQKNLTARNPPLAPHENHMDRSLDRSARLDAIQTADPLSFVRNMHAGTKSMLSRDRGVR